jgi:hypothetical protein
MKNVMNKIPFLIVLSLSLTAIYFGLYRWPKIIGSSEWPSTTGIIQDTEQYKYYRSIGERENIVFILLYSYEVDGKAYLSDRLNPGLFKVANNQNLEYYSKIYAPGKEVKVYYDPNNPGESSLETGFHWTDWFLVVFGSFFLIFAYALYPKKRSDP